MAHYKRGRCRYNGKARRPSETYIRAKLQLKPVVLPTWSELRGGAAIGSPEYVAAWLAYRHRREWPEWYKWYGSMPRWHNKIHHIRPRRSIERALARKAARGGVDLDEALWPLDKKPHIYYW